MFATLDTFSAKFVCGFFGHVEWVFIAKNEVPGYKEEKRNTL